MNTAAKTCGKISEFLLMRIDEKFRPPVQAMSEQEDVPGSFEGQSPPIGGEQNGRFGRSFEMG